MHILQLATSASAIARILLFSLATSRLISALPQAPPSSPSSPDPDPDSDTDTDPDPNSSQQQPPFNLQLQTAVIYAQPDLEGPIISLKFKGKDTSDGSDLSFTTTLGYPARFRTSEYLQNRPPKLSPDGELIPPPSRVPLPEPLTQRWRRVVRIDAGDDTDDSLDKLLGGESEGGSGSNANIEVSLHNYRGPEDFSIRIKSAESRAGPIWSVGLTGYMRKVPLKPEPEAYDIAYTSRPNKLPPFVIVGDDNGGVDATGS